MEFKKIYGKEARQKMLDGVNKLADVIGSTMSSKGRNVILTKKDGSPMVINDGVSIANDIVFRDDLENAAVQLVRDAANRTNYTCGDGTSGTIVLAREIIKLGWECVEAGANPVLLRKELLRAAESIEDRLKAMAQRVKKKEQAVQIATISVQDEELGKKIGGLMYDIGKNGAVAIKPSLKRGVFIEKDAGLRLEGQITGGIIDNEDKFETRLENAKVLILESSPEDHELESKWLPFIRQLAEGKVDQNGRPYITKINVPVLMVIAEKLSRRFIMAMNANKDKCRWIWFRPTTAEKNMKEVYKDLQALVGGQIVNEEEGVHLSTFQISSLGEAESVIAGRHEAIITVSDDMLKSDAFTDRINIVKGQLDNAEDETELEQIKQRLANLVGGIAAVKVAAATEQDTRELMLRIEDAINATRVSMEEGYLPGGGVALYNAAIESGTDGEKILKEACKAIIRQILHNAGHEDHEKVIKKLKEGHGINVLTDQVVDMKAEGIIDPLKVVRLALLHAVSVAGLLLTSEYVVVNETEDDLEKFKKLINKK